MKRLLFFLLTIIIVIACKAQSDIYNVADNEYDEYNSYVGVNARLLELSENDAVRANLLMTLCLWASATNNYDSVTINLMAKLNSLYPSYNLSTPVFTYDADISVSYDFDTLSLDSINLAGTWYDVIMTRDSVTNIIASHDSTEQFRIDISALEDSILAHRNEITALYDSISTHTDSISDHRSAIQLLQAVYSGDLFNNVLRDIVTGDTITMVEDTQGNIIDVNYGVDSTMWNFSSTTHDKFRIQQEADGVSLIDVNNAYSIKFEGNAGTGSVKINTSQPTIFYDDSTVFKTRISVPEIYFPSLASVDTLLLMLVNGVSDTVSIYPAGWVFKTKLPKTFKEFMSDTLNGEQVWPRMENGKVNWSYRKVNPFSMIQQFQAAIEINRIYMLQLWNEKDLVEKKNKELEEKINLLEKKYDNQQALIDFILKNQKN